MSDFYLDMQSVATGLLKEFRQGSLVFIETVIGTGPADDPGNVTENSYPFDGTVRGVESRYVNNTDVFVSDFQIAAPGTLPIADATGFVSVDGKRLKVVKVVRKPAAGVTVAFDIIARK